MLLILETCRNCRVKPEDDVLLIYVLMFINVKLWFYSNVHRFQLFKYLSSIVQIIVAQKLVIIF